MGCKNPNSDGSKASALSNACTFLHNCTDHGSIKRHLPRMDSNQGYFTTFTSVEMKKNCTPLLVNSHTNSTSTQSVMFNFAPVLPRTLCPSSTEAQTASAVSCGPVEVISIRETLTKTSLQLTGILRSGLDLESTEDCGTQTRSHHRHNTRSLIFFLLFFSSMLSVYFHLLFVWSKNALAT